MTHDVIEEDLPADDQQHMTALNAELARLPGWMAVTRRAAPLPQADTSKDRTGKLPHLLR